MTLTAENIQLRRPRESDLNQLHQLDNDPEVMRWINGGEQIDLDDYRREIFPVFFETLDHEVLGFWIIESALQDATKEAKKESQFLGWVCLRRFDNKDPSLGYRLCREAWGHGYATQASAALIKASRQVGIGRITASTYEKNLGSIAVMERLGMRFVRRYRLTMDDMEEIGTASVTGDVWDGDEVEYELPG